MQNLFLVSASCHIHNPFRRREVLTDADFRTGTAARAVGVGGALELTGPLPACNWLNPTTAGGTIYL